MPRVPPAVTAEQVKSERAATSGRTTPWTEKELGHGKKPLPDGFTEIQKPDEASLAAAKFAVTTHDPKLKFGAIEKAERQVVAGINYRLTLKVSHNGKTRRADAVVWQKLNGQHALTSWTWLDEDPAKQ